MKKLLCLLVVLSAFSATAFSQAFFTPDFAKQEKIVKVDYDEPEASVYGPSHGIDSDRDISVQRVRPRRNTKPTVYHDFTHADSIAELIVDLIFFISIENNLLATFDYYPYATSDYYVQFLAYQPEEFPMRWLRFNLDASAFYHPNSMLIEPNVRFEGYLFKFFGPLFENTNYIDFKGNNFYSGNFKLGLEYAFIQTFILSVSFNIQWNHYYGGQNLDPLNGLTYGVNLKSYPVKPLVLEFRFNVTDFLNQRRYESSEVCNCEYIFETVAEIGVMLGGPVELFGTWKYIQDGLRQVKEHNFGVGLKYYF